MKKFFALFMVLAMLSVAGTAMAVTVTVSPTNVAVTQGSSATATATATAAHSGTLSYSFSLGTTTGWATASGATATFRPTTSTATGYYTVTVTATETFTSGDAAGHSETVTESATARFTVTVSKAVTSNPGGGSGTATTQPKTLTVVRTIVVKVISVTKAVMPTFTSLTTAPSTTVARAISSTSGIAVIRNILANLGITVPSGATVQSGSNLQEATTSSYTAGNDAENLRNAAARLQQKSGGNTKRAIGVVPPFRPTAAGLQPIPLPKFDESMYGRKPAIDLGMTPVTGASFFAASASGDNEVVFLDSTGASTDVVPNGMGSADAGVLTAVAYVEAGATYEPIVFTEISTADAAAFDADTGTSDASVEVRETTTVEVKATDTFNPAVDENIVSAIEALYGASIDRDGLYNAAGDGWTASATETAYMTANNLVYVCSLPKLSGIANGSYIAEITFDNTPSADQVGAPTFYPNGVSASGAAASKVYVWSNGAPVEITADNAKANIAQNRLAYLVFTVANNAVTTSDFGAAEASLSEPSIVVKATNTQPGPDTPGSVGGSGGGCSAGGFALALAVLGSFIVTRKK